MRAVATTRPGCEPPRATAHALAPSSLATLNPLGVKATMLYAWRNSPCRDSVGGEVASYTSSLVAAQNGAAAATSAIQLQLQLDLGGDLS